MNKFAKTLLAELNQQIQSIRNESKKPVSYSKTAIKAIVTTLEKLKDYTKEHEFKSPEEEITFFKNIKPKFTAKLIYYNELYNIETSKTSGAKKHYNKHLKKLNKFMEQNAEFCQYMKSASTYLDNTYFLRGKYDSSLTIDTNYFQSDFSFSTSHDFKVAQLKANKAIKKYLIAKLKKNKKAQHKNQSNLQWTAPKVALIELLYALHSAQPFNNGNTSLNEIVQTFETLFNIKLGQYHRSFYELCARKTIEPTHFLNTLKENLTTRIQNADAK